MWCMSKTEVYSWRISPELKARLEEAARAESTSVARLLEQIVTEWVGRTDSAADDEEQQRRLHAEAAKHIGKIRGGDPLRAQEASQRVRERLNKNYGA